MRHYISSVLLTNTTHQPPPLLPPIRALFPYNSMIWRAIPLIPQQLANHYNLPLSHSRAHSKRAISPEREPEKINFSVLKTFLSCDILTVTKSLQLRLLQYMLHKILVTKKTIRNVSFTTSTIMHFLSLCLLLLSLRLCGAALSLCMSCYNSTKDTLEWAH